MGQQRRGLKINQYQHRIIAMSFYPALLICAVVSLLFIVFFRDLSTVVIHNSEAQSIQYISRSIVFIMIVVWILFVLIITRAFILSRNLVGAFERIIREMDEVIEGKERPKIVARDYDDLANELLKRINILIEGFRKSRQ